MGRAEQLKKLVQRNHRVGAPLVVIACVLIGAVALSVHSARWRVDLPAEPIARDRPVPKPRAASETVTKPAPAPARSLAEVANAVDEPIVNDHAAITVAKANIEDYRRLARYPRDTEPIVDAQDPLLADDQVTAQTAEGPDGTALVAFPERMSFEAPGKARIHAYLAADDAPIAPQAISGSVVDQRMRTLATVEFHDDGTGGDPVPGDHVYTAEVDVSAIDSSEDLASSYLVRVQAVTPEGDERAVATSFQYDRAGVRLTGEFRDRLEDGNLVVEAEVEVTKAGHFHIEGTLYAQGNQPIALGRSNAELDSGRQWIRIPIYGLAFHDPERGRDFDGPYQLRFVALSNTTQMPNAKLPLSEPAYRTAPYRAADFTAQPFNDPFYVEAVEREQTFLAELEAEVESAPLE